MQVLISGVFTAFKITSEKHLPAVFAPYFLSQWLNILSTPFLKNSKMSLSSLGCFLSNGAGSNFFSYSSFSKKNCSLSFSSALNALLCSSRRTFTSLSRSAPIVLRNFSVSEVMSFATGSVIFFTLCSDTLILVSIYDTSPVAHMEAIVVSSLGIYQFVRSALFTGAYITSIPDFLFSVRLNAANVASFTDGYILSMTNTGFLVLVLMQNLTIERYNIFVPYGGNGWLLSIYMIAVYFDVIVPINPLDCGDPQA